jgi:hypothetical protein
MSLWSFKQKAQKAADTGHAQKRKKTVKRSPPVAMEVKVLAMESTNNSKDTSSYTHTGKIPLEYAT